MTRRGPVRRTSGVFAVLLGLGAILASPAQGATESSDLTEAAAAFSLAGRTAVAKSPTSQLAATDPELLGVDSADPVAVVVKLDYDGSASYPGGVPGLAATSPGVTGRSLTGTSAAESSYRRYQETREAEVIAALTTAVPTARVGVRLRTVYGGFAATIPANAVEAVLAIPGVTAVQKDELRQPLTDSSAEFVNAPPVYDTLGTTANAGEGVIFANLDTGVWPEHPSFNDLGNLSPPPGPARACNFGDNPLTPANDPFACNNKLIGGAQFLDTYLALNPPELLSGARDSDGHGTHTASTAAGNMVSSVSVLGIPRSPIHGLAPGAWVMTYKVCGYYGCQTSDSAAAVGQAILDGVDVINFSVSGGNDPFTDPTELAFLDAYAAGVFVSTSAGNDGPGGGTVNHRGPWVTSVAASTQSRSFETTLTLTSTDGTSTTLPGVSITNGVSTATPLVLGSAAPYSSPQCTVPAPPGIFAGKIVACEIGGGNRVLKGFNVKQGGAVGMVLYSPAVATPTSDTHWLPTAHVADGNALLAYVAAHPGVTGQFPAGQPVQRQGDVMASFSSRGPGGAVLKPDLTAPGVQIMAGDAPVQEDATNGPPGEYFQANSGTSMAAPHVAGAAILDLAVHPTWTPGQIRSALMTSAVTDLVEQDGVTPTDPFDIGAGRIDVGSSADAWLTLDETAGDYALLGADAGTAVHLNLPSINVPDLTSKLRTTRTVTNSSADAVTFDATGVAPAGSTIKVAPSTVTLAPGESADLTITLTSAAPLGEQQFGSVVLDPTSDASPLHLPVAFQRAAGDIDFSLTCTPDSIVLRAEESTCTIAAKNLTSEDEVVDIDTTANQRIVGTGVDGASRDGRRHSYLHDVVLAGFANGVPSVDPGTINGYVPLEEFGGTLVNAIGDEDFLDFDVPPFLYGGVTYTHLAVNSNGYLIPGSATNEDNNCCNLPPGPDPTRPNNLLAPFWTDLNGTGAQGILLNVLTDGVSDWIVVEWRVNVFGTTSPRVFQVWLGSGGAQDIAFSYDFATIADPSGQPLLVGAENSAGDGEMNPGLPTTDLYVTTSPPAGGGEVSYTTTVKGVRLGTGLVTSKLVTESHPGMTTVVREPIEVVEPVAPGGRPLLE